MGAGRPQVYRAGLATRLASIRSAQRCQPSNRGVRSLGIGGAHRVSTAPKNPCGACASRSLGAHGADVRGAHPGSVGGSVVVHRLGLDLRRHPRPVVLEFPCDRRVVPAEFLAHDRCDERSAVETAVLALDRQASSPGQHVVEVERSLVSDGEEHLGSEVPARWDAFGEASVRRREVEDLDGLVAVAMQEAPNLVEVDVVSARDVIGVLLQRLVARGADEAYLVAGGCRESGHRSIRRLGRSCPRPSPDRSCTCLRRSSPDREPAW